MEGAGVGGIGGAEVGGVGKRVSLAAELGVGNIHLDLRLPSVAPAFDPVQTFAPASLDFRRAFASGRAAQALTVAKA